jgi:hypothetical protein
MNPETIEKLKKENKIILHNGLPSEVKEFRERYPLGTVITFVNDWVNADGEKMANVGDFGIVVGHPDSRTNCGGAYFRVRLANGKRYWPTRQTIARAMRLFAGDRATLPSWVNGVIGGFAGAKTLTELARKKRARKAARARWA